ncbi:MaoC family dehydratase [Aliiglaciecola sp. LCG003]|uniref:MaoC family dehydratase n=1 Tax=Aliiglaciecola sp. LCG003 TaxID=3053655 RepID=UPI0025723277|nr:MaoC family dehydratase [Aliiglaciecola sp. LCG003]WJG10750.1 MaoC family dehydratase [Aliiglaciecola sp. LCG003]WJG10756.1 MaoC family dehydratase [Aliiglaciecola sp. LCG003]
MGKNLSQLEDGEDLGSTDWLTISQQMINEFADATGDHQWIHVDPQRCAEQSPFKKTIAHGLLSTSLMPKVFYKLIQLDAKQQTLLNYGMDSLRFLESVRVDDRIRYHVKLDSTEVKNSGILYRFDCQVEIENREKPAMVGKFLMLLISGE